MAKRLSQASLFETITLASKRHHEESDFVEENFISLPSPFPNIYGPHITMSNYLTVAGAPSKCLPP